MESEIGYLCIPKIDTNIKREFIFKKLCDLHIGYIYKLVEIPLKNNGNFKRILVKVRWNHFDTTNKIRNRITSGNPVYFVYEMPWFWKIVLQSGGTNGPKTPG